MGPEDNPVDKSNSSTVEPEKYIRTFAGDVDIFEKGGMPGLAPLKEPEDKPVPQTATVAQSPVAAPVKPVVPVMPVKQVIQPAASAPVFIKKEEKPLSLKTYAQDFVQRVKETGASTTTILAEEQDATASTVQTSVVSTEGDNKNLFYSIAGIVLLIAGGVGVYVAYSKYSASTLPVEVAKTEATPIFVDARESVSGTGQVLQQVIKQSVGKPLGVNAVRLLSYEATPSISVFQALNTSVPDVILRNIDSSKSMAGIVNAPSGQSAFFILSVGTYSATFSGMLSFEPVMQDSLNAIFPLYPVPVVVPTIVATTTSVTATSTSSKVSTTTVATSTAQVAQQAPAETVLKGGWKDEVISNHDVRIYRDAQGRSIMLYGYWDQATLVIARDPLAFEEILERLASSRTR